VIGDAALIALSTFTLYLFVFVMLRLFGRRQMAQLTVVDLIIVVTLGSAVETSLIRANISLWAGIVAASTLLLTNAALTALFRRSTRVRRLLGGGPLLLVNNGHNVERHLLHAGLTRADLDEALREREYPDPADVRFAVLETDGTISVVPRDRPGGEPSSGPES
jgi:uncharacterized membrane protein YcaP (DUF421 family)